MVVKSQKRPATGQYRIKTRRPRAKVQWVSLDEGREILDRRAQELFGISGEQFSRLYQSGAMDSEHPQVTSLGMLARTVYKD